MTVRSEIFLGFFIVNLGQKYKETTLSELEKMCVRWVAARTSFKNLFGMWCLL